MEPESPVPPEPGTEPALTVLGDRLPPHPLPPQPTRFIDREQDIARLEDLLTTDDIRLLTLTGPGGVGKTRLAVAAVELVLEHFPNGVWFVDLAPLADPALVLPTIARVVGVGDQLGRELGESLAAFLRDRTALLTLDNFEHVLAAAPDLEALLAACPNLTILVTSREPLQLRREQVVQVHPLPVPSAQHEGWTVAELATLPAVEFFVARAQAADADFTLSAGNVEAVAELSRRLDGLPLAMELAAARSRFLEPAALLSRVERSLDLLRWDSPDLPPRHRTLRATLDWSHALLSVAEQTVFHRLGVFAGGFTLEAAEAVAALHELDVEPLELVHGLVDKHLVGVLDRGKGDEPRFGLLATVREYALERLVEAGEAETTRDRHLAYYLTLAEQGERHLMGPNETQWLDQVDREIDNFRLAQEWAIVRGDTEAEWRLVAALAIAWVLRGYFREGRQRVDAALARSYEPDPILRARLLIGAGLLAQWSGDYERAAVHFEGSLHAARTAGVTPLAVAALGQLCFAAYARGQVGRARALIAELLPLARAADSDLYIGYAFVWRMLIAIGPHGSPREREQLRGEIDEPIARVEAAQHHRCLSELLAGRAHLLIEVDPVAAAASLREGLAVLQGFDDPLAISIVPWLALVLLAERLPAERVARLAGAIDEQEERSAMMGHRSPVEVFAAPRHRLVLAQAVDAARAKLGEAAFAAADAGGRALTFGEIVDELLTVLEEGERALAPVLGASQLRQPDRLISPREREVLALVVAGRSNKEIAEALFVSPFTVKAHVASLLTKLDADNRAQLAAIAMQRELLRA